MSRQPEPRVVGRIGRAHGLRGEVTVEVRTDAPEQRFVPGASLHTDEGRELVVDCVRWQGDRLLVGFDGVGDREVATALRGALLTVDAAALPMSTDPDEFADHELEGLLAVGVDRADLGTVREVLHTAAQDLLVLDTAAGQALVPFVRAIVPEVDIAAGRVVLDPPPGLLEVP